MEWSVEGLTANEQTFLTSVRDATSLSELADVVGTGSKHAAYLDARERWKSLREGRLFPPDVSCGLPGDVVDINGHEFWVHGITHADTAAERTAVQSAVDDFLAAGATVYCEQGIRPMYFDTAGGICEMDDYRWALQECKTLAVDSHVTDVFDGNMESISEQVTEFASQFRDVVFSWIDTGEEFYGAGVERVLGDLASDWVTTHEDLATGRSFEAFTLREAAADDPGQLGELQQYYRLSFLPQALEREWLRSHDPELEIVTHGRNERMADYAVYHNETAPKVHLIVGAAHQPGVVEYLRAHRDGKRTTNEFELA